MICADTPISVHEVGDVKKRMKRELLGGAESSMQWSQVAVALRLVARGELRALATPSCGGPCCRNRRKPAS